MYIERDFSGSGFESIPGYRDAADSPFVVIPQTSEVLDLFLNDKILDPEPARSFLKESTFPYLNRAKQGLEIISAISNESTAINWVEIAESDIDIQEKENIEAVGYMLVIFSFMPEMTSNILPQGFSRRGMLQPPKNKSDFSDRVEELQSSVFNISQGDSKSKVPLELMKPSLSRTVAFFKTGSTLPLKFPSQNEARHAFETILGDVDIKLSD